MAHLHFSPASLSELVRRVGLEPVALGSFTHRSKQGRSQTGPAGAFNRSIERRALSDYVTSSPENHEANHHGRSCILTVAGSDSGGGAGVQADLKTIAVLGGFGMSAITALTAQNTTGVTASLPVSPEFVVQQIETVAADLPINAAKTGMMANRRIVEAVAETLGRLKMGPLVVDPVLVAKGGHPLLADEDRDSLAKALFPLARPTSPPTFPRPRCSAGGPLRQASTSGTRPAPSWTGVLRRF